MGSSLPSSIQLTTVNGSSFAEKPQSEDVLEEFVSYVNTDRPFLASMGIYEPEPEPEPEPELPDKPPIGIGQGCHIQGAIIDKNARIGPSVRIAPFLRGTDMDKNDWTVRGGIVVVPKNAIIPAEKVIAPGLRIAGSAVPGIAHSVPRAVFFQPVDDFVLEAFAKHASLGHRRNPLQVARAWLKGDRSKVPIQNSGGGRPNVRRALRKCIDTKGRYWANQAFRCTKVWITFSSTPW